MGRYGGRHHNWAKPPSFGKFTVGQRMKPREGESDWQYAINEGPLTGHIPTGDEYKRLQDSRNAEHNAQGTAAQKALDGANKSLWSSVQDDPELVKEWQDRVAKGLPGLNPDEITTLRAQHAQTKLQGQLAGRVNTYFDDPNRVAAEGHATDTMRKNALGDLAVQYTGAQTNEAQAVGRQGLQGGSVDIENRGALDRSNQAAAAGIEGEAQGQYRALRQRDQQLRTQMLAHIYAQNPGQTQGANAQLDALLAGTDGLNDLGAERSTQIDISHYGNILQSQAVGNTARNLSNTAEQYAYNSGSSNYNSSGGGW